MKYIIKRTSGYGEEKPCEEAFKHPHEKWYTRTCTEDEFNARFSSREGLWRDKGTNHSITEKGYVTRQEPDTEEWTIEINSLKELNDFASKYGELVISPEAYSSKSPEIEIYDDYRE